MSHLQRAGCPLDGGGASGNRNLFCRRRHKKREGDEFDFKTAEKGEKLEASHEEAIGDFRKDEFFITAQDELGQGLMNARCGGIRHVLNNLGAATSRESGGKGTRALPVKGR